ncbi:hypothetical protein, partial [Burkholderia pseudomallei]|uniref:hypothetical protein n=1 Tax=Burkholderia pseudomallei TaxID=28450 RepID=UPI001CA48425
RFAPFVARQIPLHHFKLEPLVVFRHEKTPKGQIYVQLLGFSSVMPASISLSQRRRRRSIARRGLAIAAGRPRHTTPTPAGPIAPRIVRKR